ncbi:L-dopachrome tautomerase yellow-f2-like [Culicoides brevitarsis]|uniref:L-dopachrome tautomerase yellow-f2-like n=1 Tax=Culicoides brevitarsis TaxID=469753 RepID=UPI00307C152E
MAYFKELVGILALIAVVAAGQYEYSRYEPYSKDYGKGKSHHKDVELHKLCSWNVVEFESCKLRSDAWHPLKLDAGRNYIPENNLPTAFQFSNDRRVFVALSRKRTGVYATLAYFNLDDVRDGCCPPLKAYPSDEANSLDADCCNEGNLVNVERFNVDRCNRLWVLDKNGLELNDKNWVLGSPKLVVFDLKTNKVLREVPLHSDLYESHQFGLDTVVINADPKDCENTHAYVLDTYAGAIVVYSYKQNKFWRHKSPEFSNDAKYTKFTLKTRKNKEVTYYRDENVFDCARDYVNNEVVCHSVGSLDEWTLPFEELESEETARCSPDSLNVQFLGRKCEDGQTGTHVLNTDNQVVWGAHELQYGAACWNRQNPLNPSAVSLVVSDCDRLPYVADLTLTKVDLEPFCGSRKRHGDETYVVLLSNNEVGIKTHGFDHKEENFGIYFFRESDALECNPQCLPKKGYSHKQPKYDHDDKHSSHKTSKKPHHHDHDDKYSKYDHDDKYSKYDHDYKHSYEHSNKHFEHSHHKDSKHYEPSHKSHHDYSRPYSYRYKKSKESVAEQ